MSDDPRDAHPLENIAELLKDAPPGEREELERVIERLQKETPYPRPGFRAMLRRSIGLGVSNQAGGASAPARLGLLIAGYAGSGTALLAVAAIGLTGIGPFAA